MPSISFTALRSPIALICFLLTAGAGVAVDQWSKHFAFDSSRPWYSLCDGVEFHEGRFQAIAKPRSVINNFLELHVMANQGAVFGIGQGKRTLFIAVSVAAIAFIIYLFAISGRQWFYQIILGMLLAGVIGNLYDRAVLQYVRDMIHVQLTVHDYFPYIFNIADSLLCVGVGLMIVHSFLQGNPVPSTAKSEIRNPKSESNPNVQNPRLQ